jgi:hypothetical protein
MGLIKKIFSGKKDRGADAEAPESSQFHESEGSTTDEGGSRNAPRRELVQVVLRDTMRKHGIPSDWIECQILSVVSRSKRTGLHVVFVIRDGEDRLVGFIHAFQESFTRELEKYEARAAEWIFGMSWQFTGKGGTQVMPPVGAFGAATSAAAAAPLVMPPASPSKDTRSDDEVEEDLKALFAAMKTGGGAAPSGPPSQPDFEPTRPSFEESGGRRR